MNIALEQTEEWVNGRKTNDYGDAFVRGNNGACLLSSLDALLYPARDTNRDRASTPQSCTSRGYERRGRG